MRKRWLATALLVLACGGPQIGVLETKTDLKIDTLVETGLGTLADIDAFLAVVPHPDTGRPHLDVEGPKGPLTAGLRETLAAAGIGEHSSAKIAVAVDPLPERLSGAFDLAVTLDVAWLHAPDITRLTGTLRGPVRYRHGGGDIPADIGRRIGSKIVELLREHQPPGIDDRPPLTPATAVAVGERLACSLHEDGAVRCWGAAGHRIGALPGLIARLLPAVEIDASGARACARLRDGTVRCWGRGLTERPDDIPPAVCSIHDATALAVGHDAGCALVGGGRVRCWALESNFDDRCGGAPSFLIAGIERAVAVAAGLDQECAITPDGRIVCWSTCAGVHCEHTERAAEPQPELGLNVAVDLGPHPCGLDATGVLRCGTGPEVQQLDLPPGATISIDPAGGCARDPEGPLLCWRTGAGAKPPTPTPVQGLVHVRDVDVGHEAACAVDEHGAVHCWGDALYGITGQAQDTDTPRRVLFVR